jgi:hypothetical protein
MPSRHVVPLTPSVSLRLSHLLCRKENEQGNFHSPYTLPSSVSRKSLACHSYAPFASRTVLRDENTGGVGAFFPFWNSSGSLTAPILVLSFHTLTNCKILQLLCFDIHTKLPGGVPPFGAQTLGHPEVQTMFRSIPFPFKLLRTFLHSRKSQLLSFQSIPHSLRKTTRGGGYSTSSTFGRSDFRAFRRVPHFPKSAIFSIP